jgi:hypothetical protein
LFELASLARDIFGPATREEEKSHDIEKTRKNPEVGWSFENPPTIQHRTKKKREPKKMISLSGINLIPGISLELTLNFILSAKNTLTAICEADLILLLGAENTPPWFSLNCCSKSIYYFSRVNVLKGDFKGQRRRSECPFLHYAV